MLLSSQCPTCQVTSLPQKHQPPPGSGPLHLSSLCRAGCFCSSRSTHSHLLRDLPQAPYLQHSFFTHLVFLALCPLSKIILFIFTYCLYFPTRAPWEKDWSSLFTLGTAPKTGCLAYRKQWINIRWINAIPTGPYNICGLLSWTRPFM